MAEADQQQGGLRVEFADMQKLYLTSQRHYKRPALSLMSSSQFRHYVPEASSWKYRKDIPDMFKVLTARDTRPEYYDTIQQSYMENAEIRDMHTNPMKTKELRAAADKKVYEQIEVKERKRKDALRKKAKARREAKVLAEVNAEAAAGKDEEVPH
jgi:hypothetical protein